MRTLAEQRSAIVGGEVTPAELTERALALIEAAQRSLNAFTFSLADDALGRAKTLADTSPGGALFGVPVVIKELFDVEGVPTTGCCTAYSDAPAARSDSAVVERLRAAGAIVVAKTNQHELAHGGTTQNSSFGAAWNPWGERRMTGGSSGGSAAAVAAGTVAVAIGSDSLGSIRIPSSWCGTTGLKPTHGSVSLYGAMPFIPSFDTAGPIASTVADVAAVHRVLAGYDPRDPLSRPGSSPPLRAGLRAGPSVSRPSGRIALARGWLARCAASTRSATEEAAKTFQSLGFEIDDVDVPDADEAWMSVLAMWSEFAASYRDLWDDDRVSREGKALLGLGRGVSGVDVAESLRLRRALRRGFDDVFERFDAILAPATPFPAPRADEDSVEVDGGPLDVRSGCARFSAPVNAAGVPALSFPAGISSEGLPLGVQLIGPAWGEETLFVLGEAFQFATDHHLRMPQRL